MNDRISQFLESLGDDLYRGYAQHEIGVTIPSGDDMPVQMAGQACAPGGAQIQSYVKSLWVKDFFQ